MLSSVMKLFPPTQDEIFITEGLRERQARAIGGSVLV